MPSVNKVILVGNMTRDPEVRTLQSGSSIANFGIATTRKYTVNGEKREETCFVDVAFFGKLVPVISQYCKKGTCVYVEGRLKLDQWQDKNTGQNRSKISVTGESFQLLSLPPSEPATPPQQQDDNSYIQPPERRETYENPPSQQSSFGRNLAEQPQGEQVDDDDIPF